MVRARRAMRVASLALASISLPQCAAAATITNVLQYGWVQHSLAVNVGDTVTWLNLQAGGTNYVESYGGEWKSPQLSQWDSFSFTFAKPGFYPYRTGTRGAPGTLLPGTVAVSAWTNAPPPVSINTPVAGSVLSYVEPALVQASVASTDAPVEMQYFANSSLIGAATSPPYWISWSGATQGQYLLVAKAIDRQGGAACSPPVSVTVGPILGVWGARRLPTGEVLFFYNANHVGVFNETIFSSDNVLMTGAAPLAVVLWPGVFVDESLRGTTVPRRFYSIY